LQNKRYRAIIILVPSVNVLVVYILATLLIILPIAVGTICLGIKNHRIRTVLVIFTALALIASSIILLIGVPLPIEITPPSIGVWDLVITVLNFAVMAFFIAMAVLDIVRRGFSRHNVLPIILTLTAGIPLALFEFKWAPHLEVSPALYIDHLSLVLLLVVSIIGSLICLYALRYMRDHEEHRMHAGEMIGTAQPRFFFFMLTFLGVMNALVIANNLLWLAFFWEMTTLCCWGLIRHDLTPLAKTNALRALWMCLIGSTGMTAAIILLWNSPLASISLLDVVHNSVLVYPALYLPFAFLFIAAFTKSAQLPFQNWLLGAMVAPTPVSALLHSSTMVNAGVYLLLRLAPSYQGTSLSTFLAVFGSMVFLVTSLLAISQSNAKRVLAYSTIANLALIVLLAGINTPLSIACGTLLLLFHAISKALLFLSAGTVEHYIWSRDIEDMEGLSHKLPVLAGIMITGIFSMIAAPFGVVIAKWGAMETTSSINIWSALVMIFLVIGSAATTVFWAKWAGRLMCHAPVPEAAKREKLVPFYHGVLLVLIAGATLFSILIVPVYTTLVAPGLIEAGYIGGALTTANWFLRSSVGTFATWPLFIILAVALIVPLLVTRVKPGQSRAAYMCGENVEIGSDQFTAEGDRRTDLKTGGFYIENVFGEGTFNRYSIPAGLVFMAILFILVVL
jgi:ech hydrogenase subunit A